MDHLVRSAESRVLEPGAGAYSIGQLRWQHGATRALSEDRRPERLPGEDASARFLLQDESESFDAVFWVQPDLGILDYII